MYNRLLLIIPPTAVGPNELAFYPLTGLGYISEVLNKNNIEQEVLDMRLGYRERDLRKRIQKFQPDLIGFSMMTFQYKRTYEIIRFVKSLAPKANIVAGGPHISTFREKVLEECLEVDFGVVLEGEESILELCKGRNPSQIRGLLFRRDKEIVYNGDREFIANLDALPFPRYDKFESDKYLSRRISLVTSRGCPYHCIYCPVKTAIGNKFRVRSAENVVDEMEYWYQKGYKEFLFQDDNFTLNPGRVFKICSLIEEQNLKGLILRLPNGIRADKVTREMLRAMKRAGFRSLAFGVEAGNNRILARIKKEERIEKIRETIRDACELGFQVALTFLIGSPEETERDIEDSFKLAQEFPVMEVDFYNLIPFPGTELFDWIKRNNFFILPPVEYLNTVSHFTNQPCFQTPQLSTLKRKKAFSHAQKISKEIKKKGIEVRLKRLGLWGKIIARIYTWEIFQKVYTHNKFIRKALDGLRALSGE